MGHVRSSRHSTNGFSCFTCGRRVLETDSLLLSLSLRLPLSVADVTHADYAFIYVCVCMCVGVRVCGRACVCNTCFQCVNGSFSEICAFCKSYTDIKPRQLAKIAFAKDHQRLVVFFWSLDIIVAL